LALEGYLDYRTVRFGASSSALTSAQLEKIAIGGQPVFIDGEGYLTTGRKGVRLILR
jgi:hypothetical protein